ncbi:MAG: hydrogenase 3 maturation endopeptidase HyCI [Candidatus Nezhaarchaeota archaeon]|nr:hydrogenase 3 maturation endopeptidase HyCI [Candidatus Nezhaarchaeota archaeon]
MKEGASLDELLKGIASKLAGARRVAVLGVGSYLRGDDAAGLRLARKLKREGVQNVLVLECSTSPESFTDKVREFGADCVVIVDAVRAGLAPGSFIVLEPSQVDGVAWDTHSPSLKLLAYYLEREANVKVVLIGIQAKELGLTVRSRVSREVAEAVEVLAKLLVELFKERSHGKEGLLKQLP